MSWEQEHLCGMLSLTKRLISHIETAIMARVPNRANQLCGHEHRPDKLQRNNQLPHQSWNHLLVTTQPSQQAPEQAMPTATPRTTQHHAPARTPTSTSAATHAKGSSRAREHATPRYGTGWPGCCVRVQYCGCVAGPNAEDGEGVPSPCRDGPPGRF
jgi:hypothetical protein